MKRLSLALLVILLIYVVPFQSDASFVELFRKLEEHGRLLSTTIDQVSPAPSPFPATNLSSGNVPAPIDQQESESCQMVSDKCDVKNFNISACVPSLGNGSQASYVLVLNGGESTLTLNVTFLPANNTVENVVVPGHQVKKVNLQPNPSGSSSVSVHVGNEECTIHLGAQISGNFYTGYLTPINGTYLLFATVVLIGATWACCKFGKTRRHLEGVPYRELEMGQQEPGPSFSIESPEGWDENWDDDDWDEEKAVRSPGSNHTRKNLENNEPLKYVDTSQWGNDWDD